MNPDCPDPPYVAIPALWAGLPAEVQAELGQMALDYAFSDFVSGEAYDPHNRLCTADIRGEAAERRDGVLNGLCDRVGELFPELFGTSPTDDHPDGMDPPWAWLDPGEMRNALTKAVNVVEAANRHAEKAAADLAQAHRRVADLEHVAAARRAQP